MKIKELTNISLEDLYWRLKFGKSKNRINLFELRTELNKYIKNPIFFLSTGRCGTKWFSDLLSLDKSLMVLHSPIPNLAIQGKLAYEILNKKTLTNSENSLLKEIFFAGREQFLRYSFKTNKRYIETNNYITFFAPILFELFPDAKFVHLYRHPGEYVRSGIRRGYYTGNTADLKRIVPLNEKEKSNWEEKNQIEKTSWLWNETNTFIETFKLTNPNQCIDFNFNELSEDNVHSLLQFLNIKISRSTISTSLNKKANVQKQGNFAKYDNWDEEQKLGLKNICNELSIKYNYKL